jgi:outer membrane protein TolC
LPTLNILDNNIKVQQRLNLSKERAFYLPAASLSGNVNKLLGKYNIPDGFDPLGNATTWNIGLGINYPIFQGNRRNKELQQSQIQLDQLALRRKDIENQLELRIRSNMENIYVAYSQVTLAREAADAAAKNFDIIQDSYNQGQVNITTLIDAQNNTLQTELNATNAIYSFILDFLNLERSIGFFYFLASEEERSNFYRGLILETSGN